MSRVGVYAVILIAGFFWLRYRNFHTVPFENNGTKPAVLFLECSTTTRAHDLEYVAVTQVTVDGEIRRPVFRAATFAGRIEIAYLCEEDIIKPNAIRKAESMSGWDGITQIWMRLRSGGEESHTVPNVDLRYYFKRDDGNEIVCLRYDDWLEGKEKVWWAVAGLEDVERAEKVLEDFLTLRQNSDL